MTALADLAEALKEAALKAGADAADAMALRESAVSVDVRHGALEHAERAEATELGLRVLVGQRQACVSASDIAPATMTALAERALAMARAAPDDPSLGLADPREIARDWDLGALDLVDPEAEPDAGALLASARALEAAALSRDGITQAEASAGHVRREVFVAQSNGFAGGHARSHSTRGVVAYCGSGTGMERDSAFEMRLHAADLPEAGEIGRRAGDRALSRLGAVKPPTGRYPVLFDERVGASLIGHLLAAINGEAIARGASWARDLMGKSVLPPGMSLVEDPLRPRGPASRPFDAEGLATRPTAFVEDGRLCGWVLDLATARRLGLKSSANAIRGPSSPPAPGITNLELTPGARSREDLIRDMGTGLLVTSLIGATINPNTGDYSRGASGFWVEGGRIAHPVHEGTIAGNLREMLATLVAADDAREHRAMRVPSLLVEKMTLAGA